APLEQNAIWDRDLADIVQRRGLAQELDLARAETDAGTNFCGGCADPFGVLEGVVVAVLGRQGESLQRFGTTLLKLTCSLGNLGLENLCVVGELLFGLLMDGDVAPHRVQEPLRWRAVPRPLNPPVTPVGGAVA